jgi:hypothetical protein
MILSYEAKLEDFLESTVRQFFRTSTARDNRIRSTLVGALIMGAVGWFTAREWEPLPISIATLASACVGAALNYFTFRMTVTSRLRNYLRKQFADRLPARVEYSFEHGHIKCATLGTTVTFSLRDLESLAVDGSYLELSFGRTGLCTVPLRVFATPAEKEAFVGTIRQEQLNAGVPRPSASFPTATSGSA